MIAFVVGTGLCWLLLKRREFNQYLRWPVSLAAGLVVASIASFVLMAFRYYFYIPLLRLGPDIVIGGALLVWVYLRRSKASLYSLFAYEAAGIIFGGMMLFYPYLGDEAVLVVIATIGVRIIIIVQVGKALEHVREFSRSASD